MDKRIDALFDIEREINGLAADERLIPTALAFDSQGIPKFGRVRFAGVDS